MSETEESSTAAHKADIEAVDPTDGRVPSPVADFEQLVHQPLRDCWFLTGPTASGKTPLAITLAQRLNAEIISLDSMAIYQGMDIGTAKPSREDRQRVVHHMLDLVAPTVDFSVSRYVTEAHAAAARIREKGKRVLVCGGTPLYLKSLLRGLFLGPPADWEFRDAVEKDIERHGIDALRARLMQVDPLAAHKLHPNDKRRIIRALEVARATGEPLSHWQSQFESPAPVDRCAVAVLKLDRAWLHERINTRVENMLAEGLEAEVRSLIEKHGTLGRTAAQAVGYREMLDYIHGNVTLDETSELMKAHTRQFARRQEIWFRGLKELQGVVVEPSSSIDELVESIATIFSSTSFDGSTLP